MADVLMLWQITDKPYLFKEHNLLNKTNLVRVGFPVALRKVSSADKHLEIREVQHFLP